MISPFDMPAAPAAAPAAPVPTDSSASPFGRAWQILPATSSSTFVDPRFLSYRAPRDVASSRNICRALPLGAAAPATAKPDSPFGAAAPPAAAAAAPAGGGACQKLLEKSFNKICQPSFLAPPCDAQPVMHTCDAHL